MALHRPFTSPTNPAQRPSRKRSRLTVAATLVTAAVAGLIVAGPGVASAEAASVNRSGMPWASGVYVPGSNPSKHADFGSWRGAATDVAVDWPARRSWNDIVNPSWLFDAWKGTPQTKVFGVAPIPEDGSGTLQGCASGAYNDKWTQFGQNIKASGLADTTIIRLGWEFNGNWFKWSASDPEAFAGCWRQIYTTVEDVAPGLRWDWTVNRGRGQSVGDARLAWPGDAYVDIVGVDSYDGWPGATSESSWDEHYNGAYGLKFWADYARSKGKKLSVPEWGVYPGTAWAGHNGGDNPFYIKKMFGFFNEQKDILAYEAYFNESSSYYAGSLYNPGQNPKAAAEYKVQIGAAKQPSSPPDPDPAYDANGVRLVAPVASTRRWGATISTPVAVSSSRRFVYLQIAVRDAQGRGADRRGGLDVAYAPGVTVTSARDLKGARRFDPGTYTAFAAYSLDGKNWVEGPASTFTVGPVVRIRPHSAVSKAWAVYMARRPPPAR